MKVRELMKKLGALKSDLDVIIDGEDDSYYNLEDVGIFTDEYNDEAFANLISSNEA